MLAIVVAGLRDDDLEGPYLTDRHRSDMTGVDGQRNRLGRYRRRGPRRYRRLAFQPGTNPQGPLPEGLHPWRRPEGEEVVQQRPGTPTRQPGAHPGEGGLIPRGWAIGAEL